MAILLVAAAAACGTPDVEDMAECGANGQCPKDFTCNAVDNRCYTTGSFTAVAVKIVVAGTGKVTVGAVHPDCTGSCSYAVPRGSALPLLATPGSGNDMVGWSGACAGKAPRTTVTPSGPMTCTATFAPKRSLMLGVPGGGGQIAGDATCAAASCSVPAGTADVTLEAVADAGWRFDVWSGDGSCSSVTTPKVTVATATTTRCLASFVRRVKVTGAVAGAKATVGAASLAPHAECAGATCVVDAGRMVELTAPTVDGFRLVSWSGAGCSGSGPVITVTAAADTTCTATYARGVAVLASVVGAPAVVTATSSSPGAMCHDGGCVLDEGGTVTLSVPEVAGHRWLGWGGDARCSGGARTLTLAGVTGSVSCVARFARRVLVDGVVSGAGGSVAAASAAETAECDGGGCVVDVGTAVALTAPVVDGFVFTGWTGGDGCAGDANPLLLVALGDVTCTAGFEAERIDVGGVVSGATAEVAASSAAAGASCVGGSCSVIPPADVTLVAPDLGGWRFVGWSGEGCEGDQRTLELHAVVEPTVCVAEYAHRVTIGAVVTGASGQVSATSSAPGAVCRGPSCIVDAGSSVTLTAPVIEGSRFTGWSGGGGACSGSANPLVLAATADTTCTASYASACWEGCTGTCEGTVCWQNEILISDGSTGWFTRQARDTRGRPSGGTRIMGAALATGGAGTQVGATESPVTALLAAGSWLYVMTEAGTVRINRDGFAVSPVFTAASFGDDLAIEGSTQSAIYWLVPGDGVYRSATTASNGPEKRVSHVQGGQPSGLAGAYENLYWIDGGEVKSMYIHGTVPQTVGQFSTVDKAMHVPLRLYGGSLYWLMPGGKVMILGFQTGKTQEFPVTAGPGEGPLAVEQTGVYWAVDARSGKPTNVMRMPAEGGSETAVVKGVQVQDMTVANGTIYVLGPNKLERYTP